MKKLLFAIGALLAGSVQAVPIGTYNPNDSVYMQAGVVTNNSSQVMVGFRIDFVADSGSPASGIWELPPIGSLGSPVGTFTNQPAADGAFTVSWFGLNVGTGGTFSYTGLDYGGWNGTFVDEGLAPGLRGDEVATMFFADGSSVSALFAAGGSQNPATLVFDDSNLVRPNATPEPGSLALLGLAFAGLGWSRRQRRTA
ncbi:MAG: PEP-CTERM sorting domain-containing protein [Burkholderiales bacterium]|nr:PEP-CTERM sorting domain-containing protein [Burkholderiales bacterium]